MAQVGHDEHIYVRRHLLIATRLSLLLSTLALLACSRSAEHPAGKAATNSAKQLSGEHNVAPYPKGRWRLAPMDLAPVMQTLSHIAIRDVGRGQALSIYLHRPSEAFAGPGHDTAEGLSLASKIQAEVMRNPRSFGELAKRYSEDPWTAMQGGNLGTVDAALLAPCFLDALAAMPDNSVSQVIGCEMGFHILYKRTTPPEEFLAGYEISLGYEGLHSFDLTRGDWRGRDRATTLALAQRLVQELRAEPARFQEIVRAYSNSETAERDGYLGSRSTYHTNTRATEYAALQALPIGAISDPIETIRGFVIYLRSAHRPQSRIAMEEVLLPYDPTDHASAMRTGELATRLFTDIKERPPAFAQYQQEYCCARSTEEWELETRTLAIETALVATTIGEIANGPVQSNDAFHILKRLEPTGRGQPESRFQIESPTSVNVEALFAQAPPQKVGEATRQMRDESTVVLALETAEAKRYRELLTAHAAALETAASPDDRRAAIRENRTALGALLGPKRLAIYDDFVAQWMFHDLMNAP
jgi:parvulin-like peptidyl-prolyl isomerase